MASERAWIQRLISVSHADRVVFPEVNRTKGEVVAYYERIAPRLLPHVMDRPLSIMRFPKGLASAGFFQKNVPPHYPDSIQRLSIPRSTEAAKKHKRTDARTRAVTIYPIIDRADHLPYLANQGAIEFHVPTAHASKPIQPDRIIIDLDPPSGAFPLVRLGAQLVRRALEGFGLATVPIATGSKGYHLVAAIEPAIDADRLGLALQKTAVLLAARHPDELTTAFRIALRGERVFVDWLRNRAQATAIAPYSLRARPRATVATPLDWAELESIDPDAFTIADVDRLLDRPDTLGELAGHPIDAAPFIAAIDAEFERCGLVLETFDRFRS
jgi:bifunctional non-homologous end joining protein LigD